MRTKTGLVCFAGFRTPKSPGQLEIEKEQVTFGQAALATEYSDGISFKHATEQTTTDWLETYMTTHTLIGKNLECSFVLFKDPNTFVLCKEPNTLVLCKEPNTFVVCKEPNTFVLSKDPNTFVLCKDPNLSLIHI